MGYRVLLEWWLQPLLSAHVLCRQKHHHLKQRQNIESLTPKNEERGVSIQETHKNVQSDTSSDQS